MKSYNAVQSMSINWEYMTVFITDKSNELKVIVRQLQNKKNLGCIYAIHCHILLQQESDYCFCKLAS